jgi:imidazolonepropionase
MWDRLLVDCHIATMDPAVAAPFGAIGNGAIGIQDGRIVRIGKRTELAGYQAKKVEALAGAWVTPGLIDCHTHLVFAGNRAGEFEQRLEGASYAEIAAAGGGIVSTVAATRAASRDELVEAARPRLRALMRGGCTTVEIKSGYGLDAATEIRMLEAAKRLGETETVRIERTLLALHALPAEYRDERAAFVRMTIEEILPAVAERRLASAVDAFCEGIGFTPQEVRSLFEAARRHGFWLKLHAEQLSNLRGAELAADFRALSADHLEHADEQGVAAMARAHMAAVLLPGAFYALKETKRPPVDLLRRYGVPMAIATDCNPGTSRGAGGHDPRGREGAGTRCRDRYGQRRQGRGPVRLGNRAAGGARLLDRPPRPRAADHRRRGRRFVTARRAPCHSPSRRNDDRGLGPTSRNGLSAPAPARSRSIR